MYSESETEDMMILLRVATMSATAHKNQERENGGNYVRHPLAVAALIEPQWATLENMCVAICHDILEDVEDMLEEAAKEMAITFGGAFNDVLSNWQTDNVYNFRMLLAACKSPNNWVDGTEFAETVTNGVLELTVVWPRPDHPDDDPKDRVSRKQHEVERIQHLSMEAAAVTKADKTFNSRYLIPGRDPAKEAEKYRRYFDAVDKRMNS